MSKIVPITVKFTSDDFNAEPKNLGLGSSEIFTGVLSIGGRVTILSNPSIPPIDVDIDVDSQDDNGLVTRHTFKDGDGNEHTVNLSMNSSSIAVVVTDDKSEVEDQVEVEIKLRIEVESPAPKKEEKEATETTHVFPHRRGVKDAEASEDKDIREHAVGPTNSTKRMLDQSRVIYVLGQDDLIWIVGFEDETLDHEKCSTMLNEHWRKEHLNNLDAEDRELIKNDKVALLPFEVAVEMQNHLVDVLRRTYGVPTLTCNKDGHYYYLPLVDHDGVAADPSLIACLDRSVWKAPCDNILPQKLKQHLAEKQSSVLSLKQALIKQQYLKA